MLNIIPVLFFTFLYSTILYYTILYYTILYYTILYYTILYYTILYYTILIIIPVLYYTNSLTVYAFFFGDVGPVALGSRIGGGGSCVGELTKPRLFGV